MLIRYRWFADTEDRLGDIRGEIAEADDPSDIGRAHTFTLGKRSRWASAARSLALTDSLGVIFNTMPRRQPVAVLYGRRVPASLAPRGSLSSRALWLSSVSYLRLSWTSTSDNTRLSRLRVGDFERAPTACWIWRPCWRAVNSLDGSRRRGGMPSIPWVSRPSLARASKGERRRVEM